MSAFSGWIRPAALLAAGTAALAGCILVLALLITPTATSTTGTPAAHRGYGVVDGRDSGRTTQPGNKTARQCTNTDEPKTNQMPGI
jgi:hypothetical protein